MNYSGEVENINITLRQTYKRQYIAMQFYQNQLSSVEVTTKTFWCFFGSQ